MINKTKKGGNINNSLGFSLIPQNNNVGREGFKEGLSPNPDLPGRREKDGHKYYIRPLRMPVYGIRPQERRIDVPTFG